jgi:hypothetical protein
MAKAKDDSRPPETRPPVTNPPGGLAPPPPALGPELEDRARDTRPAVDANETAPGDVRPDTVPGSAGFGVQPARPDQTTQGQRPQVGGSSPEQTHPDRPDIAGGQPPIAETEKLARERAARPGGTGNVYMVNPGQYLTTGHTGHVTETDLPAGTDIPRLLRLGVISPVGNLKSDPYKAKALGPEGLAEVEEMQERAEAQEAEIIRLREENARLKSSAK